MNAAEEEILERSLRTRTGNQVDKTLSTVTRLLKTFIDHAFNLLLPQSSIASLPFIDDILCPSRETST
jgi:hypothetical protein